MALPDELLPPEPDLQREATKSWADGLAELAAVWADPGWIGAPCPAAPGGRGSRPFEFVPDMPSAAGDDTRALDEEELDQLVMPTFDGIGHDGRWTRIGGAAGAGPRPSVEGGDGPLLSVAVRSACDGQSRAAGAPERGAGQDGSRDRDVHGRPSRMSS